MGFIENLAKGFVRSAVNQVGRDTGKVVSNKIYGNAHARPYYTIFKRWSYNFRESSIALSEMQSEKIKQHRIKPKKPTGFCRLLIDTKKAEGYPSAFSVMLNSQPSALHILPNMSTLAL